MTKNALILCCDSAFFALAKGTILSLHDHDFSAYNLDICFIDIGLEEHERQWLRDRNIIIKSYDDIKIFESLPDYFKNYNKSQVIRPFLPKIFPGYDIYMWSDTDIWFQKAEGITRFLDFARDYAPKIAIVPTVDTSYQQLNYANFKDENYGRFLQWMKIWYQTSFDERTSIHLYGRALFSSGVFALHRDSDIWTRWAQEFKTVFNRDYSEQPFALHVAEQTALNKVIYDTQNFTPLTALYNYNCHIGTVKRDAASDKIVIGYPPYDEVAVIHLTYSSKFMPQYVEQGLLYQGGAYLEPAERERLSGIKHYGDEN